MSDDIGWEDQLAGHRMAVDRDFAETIQESELTNSQWGLVMTAVDFEIESPEDPPAARLVANTSKLEHVLPEMRERAGAQGFGGSPTSSSDSGQGFIDRIKQSIIGTDDETDELEAEATRLANDYATRLQARLESEGVWETICTMAAEER